MYVDFRRQLNLLLTKSAQVGSWSIVTALGSSQTQEDGNINHSHKESWHKGSYQPRD